MDIHTQFVMIPERQVRWDHLSIGARVWQLPHCTPLVTSRAHDDTGLTDFLTEDTQRHRFNSLWNCVVNQLLFFHTNNKKILIRRFFTLISSVYKLSCSLLLSSAASIILAAWDYNIIFCFGGHRRDLNQVWLNSVQYVLKKTTINSIYQKTGPIYQDNLESFYTFISSNYFLSTGPHCMTLQ